MYAGEGSFLMHKTTSTPHRFYPVVSISQRDDNYIMMQEIIRLWKLEKHVYSVSSRKKPGKYNHKPTLQLSIRDTMTIASRVIPTFSKYQTRTKKQDEFDILKIAIDILLNKRQEDRLNLEYTDDERQALSDCHDKLQSLKKYKEPEYIPLEIKWYSTS